MIRTMLEIKHYSREGKLMRDSFKEWSHSYTRRFIEALYLSHARILTATPYTTSDVMGSISRAVDSDSYSAAGLIKSNMRVVGPSGYAGVPLFGGSQSSYSSGYFPYYDLSSIGAGHQIGIVIGRDDTAVTPLDSALADRIHHGTGATVVSGTVESYTADLYDTAYSSATYPWGILIIPKRSFTLTDIKWKMWRTGSPGDITCYVTGVQGSYYLYPDATVLATSTAVSANAWGTTTPGTWYTWNFPTPLKMLAGHYYWVVFNPTRINSSNYINWRYTNVLPKGRVQGAFQQATWPSPATQISSQAASCPVYDLIGTMKAEMEHGGTDVYGLSVSNPTASFILRRIFMNNSSESITVKEAGIYFPLTRYQSNSSQTYDYNNFIVCAARDTFAGIAVANGESIEVTYTPQITV